MLKKNLSVEVLHGGMVVSTAVSQQEGSRFESLLCVAFALSPHICVGTPASSHRSKTCMLG